MDELRKKIEALLGEIEGIRNTAKAEKRDITEAEDTTINAKLDEVDKVQKRMDQIERENEIRQRIEKPTTEAVKPDVRNSGIEMGADREAEKPFASFGEQLRAIVHASAPGGRIDKRLLSLNEKESRAAGTGSVEGVGSDGGFLVQTDFANELWKRTYNNSVIAPLCARRQISSGANSIEISCVDESSRADGSRFGGVRAYWGVENGGTTSSKPAFGKIKLDLKDLYALYYASDQVLEDASMLEAEVNDMFAMEMAFKLQDAIVNGDGSGKPLGVMSAPCKLYASKVSGQAATTLKYENIVAMWARMYGPSRANAVWCINQDIEPQLFTMSLAVGTGGAPVYIPANGAAGSPYGTLFGRPVLPIEQCQTLGTEGDIILADFSQYVLAEKGGIRGASSIHLKFDYFQTTFRWHYRVDGQPRWKAALTPFTGSSNTQSPFVTLETR